MKNTKNILRLLLGARGIGYQWTPLEQSEIERLVLLYGGENSINEAFTEANGYTPQDIGGDSNEYFVSFKEQTRATLEHYGIDSEILKTTARQKVSEEDQQLIDKLADKISKEAIKKGKKLYE